MLTLLLSMIIAAACVFAGIAADIGRAGTIAGGITSFIVAMFLIGYLIRKKSKVVTEELQDILMSAQKRMNQKIQQFQNKPGGNFKLMQQQIERDQKIVIQKALDFTAAFEPLKKWNLLMGNQIATMRLQFLYQLKEFEQVDQLLAKKGLFSKPILTDPMPVAMKIARQFKHKDIERAEKSFKRHVKWFRGDRGTLLYALMSWIYVKEGEIEKARQLLAKAKDITASPALAHNWEQLSNDNHKKFSNVGLGDEWFGLYLEKPPAPKQQRVRGKSRGGRPF